MTVRGVGANPEFFIIWGILPNISAPLLVQFSAMPAIVDSHVSSDGRADWHLM